MTAATAFPNAVYPAPAAGTPLLGEIVTWEVKGVNARHSHLVQALADAGLDASRAKTLSTRNAFIRAASKLTEKRIIRKVDETPTALLYQFTEESLEVDHLEYRMEAILTLQKDTGDIVCPDPEILSRARAAFDEALDRRTSSDVTNIVQRLFEDRRAADLDLVPLRDLGGVYFVRAEKRDFVDRVEDFLGRLNCRMNRFPVAAGTESGDRCVREAVAAKMDALVSELDAAVEDFAADTSDRTLKTAAERVKLLRFKIDSYALYLDDEKARLQDVLDAADSRLRAKVAVVVAARSA